jgi:hypothetical protein
MDIQPQRHGIDAGLPSRNYRLIDVPPEHVEHVKSDVEHWIDQASSNSSYFSSDDVWAAIQSRSAQLWLVWNEIPEAVCVTQLSNTSKGKHCSIWIMVGSGMVDWLPLIDDLEAWAKREGCNLMRHEARAGWSKPLKKRGYFCPHVILEKEL